MKHRPILLVEDNPDDELLALRALRKKRFMNDVIVARDGVEALEYLFDRGPEGEEPLQPMLVLLDLKLPRLDGLEVLARLRADARTRRLPVVILTSSRENVDIQKGYDLGANSYIVKPVDFEQFVDAVAQIGFYWMLLNESPS